MRRGTFHSMRRATTVTERATGAAAAAMSAADLPKPTTTTTTSPKPTTTTTPAPTPTATTTTAPAPAPTTTSTSPAPAPTATTAAPAASTSWTQTAWKDGQSGCSAVVDRAAWQTAGLCTTRAIADIAAVADPNTGLAVYDSYNQSGWLQIGGTSLASPLWLGAWARLQASHGNALGFAAPKLYALYDAAQTSGGVPVGPAGFHDVVLGTNGAYTALPGYDFTTGLGTPDLTALSKVLK